MGAVFEAAVIVILILVNGLLSLSETAIVASSRHRLKARADAGGKGAASALRLVEQPERFFSTVQVGITLIGVASGAFGGATLARRASEAAAGIPWLAPYADAAGLTAVVLPVSYLTLVLGELVPKNAAYSRPETFAAATAPAMRVMASLARPVVAVLSLSTRAVMALLRVPRASSPTITEDEIRGIVGEGMRSGAVQPGERELIERIFRFGDRKAEALMTHRSRIEWLDLEDPDEVNRAKLKAGPISRFPVARGDLAEIVGYVKAREVLSRSAEPGIADIEASLRKPIFVPETLPALRLLEIFRRDPASHFAMVIDEFGDVQGVITPNDMLEALVGDLPSGAVGEEPDAVRRDDGSWLLSASLPEDEARHILGVALWETGEEGTFATLAGFVLTRLGRLPAIGDHFEWKGWRFEVVDMDGRRVDRVLASPLSEEEGLDGDGA